MAKGEVHRLWIRFGADAGDFTKGFKALDARLGTLQKRLGKLGRGMTMALTVPIALATAGALGSFEKLETGLANVSTLLGGDVDARVADFQADIKRLSVESGKSFDDLTGGLYQVVSAFEDSAETAERLEIAVKAGVAGVASTLDAVNLLSAVTKGYGDTSADAMRKVSDLAFQTVKLGQTTFPELASAIGRTTPLAAALNMKVEELFGSFATLTGVTGSTAEVSTSVAAILRAMIKPTTDMSAAIKRLEFRTAKAMMEQLGMVGALRALISTTDGTQESIAALFGRAQALTAVFALTGAQAEVFDRKLKAMYETTGMTDAAFERQMNTIKVMRAQLKQMFMVILANLGERLAPMLRDTIFPMFKSWGERIQEVVDRFSELPPELQRATVALVGLTAALGPLLFLSSKVVLLVKGLWKMKVALAAMAGGPVVLGLGALGLAMGGIGFKLRTMSREGAEYQKMLEELEGGLKRAKAGIIDIGQDFEKEQEELTGVLKFMSNIGAAYVKNRPKMQAYEKTLRAETLAIEEQASAHDKLRDSLETVFQWREDETDAIRRSAATTWGSLHAEGLSVAMAKRLDERVRSRLEEINKLTDAEVEVAEKAKALTEQAEQMSEATRNAYSEIGKEMMSGFDQELVAIQEQAKAYYDLGVKRNAINKWVDKKHGELATKTAEERLSQLKEITTAMEESFYPRFYTPQALARRAAEAGIESRFNDPRAAMRDRLGAATSQQSESSRLNEQTLKVLQEIRESNERIAELIERNPAGAVA